MKKRSRVRWPTGQAASEPTEDWVAIEEPLEIRVASEPLAITMRTPGDDPALAVGFLYAEGVVRGIADVGTVTHCGHPGDEGWGNVIDVRPGPGVTLDVEALEGARRGTLTTAACGTCGRRSIRDLMDRIEPIGHQAPLPLEVVRTAPDTLLATQHGFAATGGLHAAAGLDQRGRLLAHAEDIGRHNAVDKVIGRLLYDARLDETALLVVSGRVSFEIVQKACVAGIAVIAAVSAPTSLAVDLATHSGVTLAAFVREDGLNLYSHPDRLVPEPA